MSAVLRTQTLETLLLFLLPFSSNEHEILQSVGVVQKYNLISIFYPSDFDFTGKLINPQALLKNNFCLISLLCPFYLFYTWTANQTQRHGLNARGASRVW